MTGTLIGDASIASSRSVHSVTAAASRIAFKCVQYRKLEKWKKKIDIKENDQLFHKIPHRSFLHVYYDFVKIKLVYFYT